MQEITVIGLMSGTSMDGVDAAAITTDGVEVLEIGPSLTLPYTGRMRERMRMAIMNGNVGDDSELERDITIAHSDAVQRLSEEYNIKADLIGFHGQTILHKPDEGFTHQIGDGKLLASLTGVDVVNDFRTADMKAGGQGAPLVPVYHMALAAHLEGSMVFLNIGGVANVTWIGEREEMLAFDVGPGNALIDDVVKLHFGKEYDDGGEIAQKGEISHRALRGLMQEPFFATPPPKSLDRNEFDVEIIGDLEPYDQVATLTQFTASGIIDSFKHFPSPPAAVYVAGGGRKNGYLLNLLRAELGNVVRPIDELGLDGDALEAQAFAYLAARVLYELPITFPNTTGCRFSPIGNAAMIHRAD